MSDAHRGTFARALLVYVLLCLSGCGLVEGPVQVVQPPEMADMSDVDSVTDMTARTCPQEACSESGVSCTGNTYQTCALDDDGCAVFTDVTCRDSEVCVDSIGCAPEVEPCTNECPSAGTTTCDPDDPNSVLTCIIDPARPSCLIWNRQTCDGEVLGCRVDGGGVASCARVRCPSSQCEPGDQRCADGDTVQTCAVDTDDPLGCTTFENSECPMNQPVCNANTGTCDTTCVRACDPDVASVLCLDANTAASCQPFAGPNGKECSTLQPVPCGEGEACEESTGQCTPHDDVCPDVGTYCTPSGEVVTCALADNVRRASMPEVCPAGRTCAGGQCVCTDECTAGVSRCGEGGRVEVCAEDLLTGCLRFQVTQSCSGRQVCVESNVGPITTAACVCAQSCTLGAFSCMGGRTQRCIADDDGCAYVDTYKDGCTGLRAGVAIACDTKSAGIIQCAAAVDGGECTRETVTFCRAPTRCINSVDAGTGTVSGASCR